MNAMKIELKKIQMLEGDGDGGGSAPPAAPPAAPPNWRETLPDDLKSDPMLGQIPDIPTLAKTYINAERMIGKKRIAMPPENADEGQWNEFYKAVGRPDAHTDYQVPEFDGLPDEMKFDDAELAKAKEAFHKAGLTQKQFQAVMDYYGGYLKNTWDMAESQRSVMKTQAEAELKNTWKDQFPHRMEMAKVALQKFGGAELASNPEIANNPSIVKAFANIGQVMIEDSATGKGTNAVVTGQTAALAEIESLQGDKEFMAKVFDRTAIGHKQAMEKWQHLFRQAYPDQKAG